MLKGTLLVQSADKETMKEDLGLDIISGTEGFSQDEQTSIPSWMNPHLALIGPSLKETTSTGGNTEIPSQKEGPDPCQGPTDYNGSEGIEDGQVL